MPHIRLFAAMLALCITVGCKAQTTPPSTTGHGTLSTSELDRRIQIMVRSEFNIPPDYNLTLQPRKPSNIPGYETLPIVISHGEDESHVNFLISNDNKTLARLETFDLDNDPVFSIDVTGRPIRGNPDAKVTVIGFDDLECPYCARMHETLFPATLDRYKDKVRFIYKDYPLPPEMHPWAMHAAVDANCLAAQSGDAYWAYVDFLHAHHQEVSGADHNVAKSDTMLDMLARQQAVAAKFSQEKLDTLNACLAAQDESVVRASMRVGDSLKVEGVPALFINGERIDGVVSQDKVWTIIDRALRAAGVEPPPAPPPPLQPSQGAAN